MINYYFMYGSVQSTILIPFMVYYILNHVNAIGLNSVVLNVLSYSRKILRAPIFEDFEVFCSTSKILSLNFVKSQELI